MTTANMKLVILDVPLEGEMESPDQKLEDGESIVRRVIEVKDLYKVLKGMLYSLTVVSASQVSISTMNLPTRMQEYDEKKVRKQNKIPIIGL